MTGVPPSSRSMADRRESRLYARADEEAALHAASTALRADETASGFARVGALVYRVDVSGALHLPEHATLVVSDLHLEKGSSFARRGSFLPPHDTRDTLTRLAAVVARLAPKRVIALGDSFHDRDGPARLGPEENAMLAALMAERDWIWILGNHDPALPDSLPGERADGLVLDGTVLRHAPSGTAAPEIAGHLHPVAKVVAPGRAVRRRCVAASARRLVLPAFGAYAGGLNVCDRAFRPLFPDGLTAHVLGDRGVYRVAEAMLRGD